MRNTFAVYFQIFATFGYKKVKNSDMEGSFIPIQLPVPDRPGLGYLSSYDFPIRLDAMRPFHKYLFNSETNRWTVVEDSSAAGLPAEISSRTISAFLSPETDVTTDAYIYPTRSLLFCNNPPQEVCSAYPYKLFCGFARDKG